MILTACVGRRRSFLWLSASSSFCVHRHGIPTDMNPWWLSHRAYIYLYTQHASGGRLSWSLLSLQYPYLLCIKRSGLSTHVWTWFALRWFRARDVEKCFTFSVPNELYTHLSIVEAKKGGTYKQQSRCILPNAKEKEQNNQQKKRT